jgi:hypothetical protein
LIRLFNDIPSASSFDEELLYEEAETRQGCQVNDTNRDLSANSSGSFALVKETVEETTEDVDGSQTNCKAGANESSSQNGGSCKTHSLEVVLMDTLGDVEPVPIPE